MKSSLQHITLSILGLGFALISVSCKPQATIQSSTPASQLQARFISEKPEGAIPVQKARRASPGESIVVTGVIGGALSPFTQGYASFILADDEIVFCNEMEDDHCSTPWDACCEDRDKLKAMRLVAQVLDDQGSPIPEGLKGVRGLKELDTVILSGIVDDGSTSDNMILNITSIYH
jgi:hypothetical protein